MNEWWNALTALQKFFYFVSIPSTLILVIQFILSFIGIDSGSDGDMDGDIGGDFDADTSIETSFDLDEDVATSVGDFRFVSFRGIIAFLTIFGWVGQVLSDTELHIAVILLIATISGLLAMLFVAGLFYFISRLQTSGNIHYKNAIGSLCEVYIPIPKNHSGQGKVHLTLQERYIEADAITMSHTSFKTGDIVRVVDIFNGTTLVVDKEE